MRVLFAGAVGPRVSVPEGLGAFQVLRTWPTWVRSSSTEHDSRGFGRTGASPGQVPSGAGASGGGLGSAGWVGATPGACLSAAVPVTDQPAWRLVGVRGRPMESVQRGFGRSRSTRVVAEELVVALVGGDLVPFFEVRPGVVDGLEGVDDLDGRAADQGPGRRTVLAVGAVESAHGVGAVGKHGLPVPGDPTKPRGLVAVPERTRFQSELDAEVATLVAGDANGERRHPGATALPERLRLAQGMQPPDAVRAEERPPAPGIPEGPPPCLAEPLEVVDEPREVSPEGGQERRRRRDGEVASTRRR